MHTANARSFKALLVIAALATLMAAVTFGGNPHIINLTLDCSAGTASGKVAGLGNGSATVYFTATATRHCTKLNPNDIVVEPPGLQRTVSDTASVTSDRNGSDNFSLQLDLPLVDACPGPFTTTWTLAGCNLWLQ